MDTPFLSVADDYDFPDCMTDTETGGLDYSLSMVLSLCAIRFNLAKRKVDYRFFYQALQYQSNRYWDEQTRDWWASKGNVYAEMMKDSVPTEVGLQRFIEWSRGQQLRYWSMPSHFDFAFWQRLFTQQGYKQKFMDIFHYRATNDMNSFLRGAFFPEEVPDVWKVLTRHGPAHNALYDTLHQINVLFTLMDLKEGKTTMEKLAQEHVERNSMAAAVVKNDDIPTVEGDDHVHE